MSGLGGKDDTYVGDPPKDVGIEADMVVADIKSTLDQDFFLKSTTVIYFRFFVERIKVAVVSDL